MIPFWQIRNQYDVNKERQNKSKCLHLHKYMQSKSGVETWQLCLEVNCLLAVSVSLHHRAGETAERDVTPPPPNKRSAAVCFVWARAQLIEMLFVSSKIGGVLCTDVLHVQQQEAEESRWIIQAMTTEHLCWFYHSKKQEGNETDGRNNKPHQNRFQSHLNRSRNVTEADTPCFLMCFSSLFTPSAAGGINRSALDSSRYSRCCGLLTIDPFGLRVVSLELCLEQILYSQLGVAPSLVVNCKKKNKKKTIFFSFLHDQTSLLSRRPVCFPARTQVEINLRH